MHKSFNIAIKHSCRIFMATMLVAVFSSCVKENMPSLTDAGENIRFEIQNDNWNKLQSKSSVRTLHGPSIKDTLFLHISSIDDIQAGTKASPVTTETFYSSIGVSAFKYKGEWSEELTPDYIYNEQLLKEKDWTSSQKWPGSAYNIKFFAYAPYGCKGLTHSDKNHAGSPLLTYTVPDNAQDQIDILAADTGELPGDGGSSAELEFSHIMTALRIVTAADILPGKITKISLKGVYGAGTYSYATRTWTTSAKKDFTQTLDISVDGTENQPLMDDSYTFMMIPQTLPAGATIDIDFIDKFTSTTHSLTASIAGIVWPIGECVTFKISTASISIEPILEIEIPEFTYEGGTSRFYVTSYTEMIKNDRHELINEPWTAEFVEQDDNGEYLTVEKPEWIENIALNGEGSTYGASFNLTVKPQEITFETPHDDALRQAEPVSGVFDLSTNGGTEPISTSNCYIVNAPGTYSLPLVYGNAINNGADNPEAYTQPLSQLSGKFVNHRNAVITDPYIYNNSNCVPDNAVVSWQDAPELVSNIRLNGDKTEILFDVNQGTIKQGNAVISIRDASNTVMWNWHIWVTDYREGEKLVTINTNSRDHEVMPYVVGFCFNKKQVYKERKAILKIKNNATEAYITILQNGNIREWGHSTVYQWGVTCPMLPWSGIENATGDERNKTWYDSNGTQHTENFPIIIGNSISNRIKNPVGIVSRFGNSYGSTSNMWNAALVYNAAIEPSYKTEETNKQIKTIYCPCPRNYTLMPFYLNRYIKQNFSYQNTDNFYVDYDLSSVGAGIFRLYRIHGRDIERNSSTNEYTAEVDPYAQTTIWTSLYRMTIANINMGACDEVGFPVMSIKEQ